MGFTRCFTNVFAAAATFFLFLQPQRSVSVSLTERERAIAGNPTNSFLSGVDIRLKVDRKTLSAKLV